MLKNRSPDALQPEGAIWCAIGWVVLIARLIARRMRLGHWRSLEIEDALAVVAIVCATVMMVFFDHYIRLSNKHLRGKSDLIATAAIKLKFMIAADQMQIMSIWTTKAGMLLLYNRLTALCDKRKQVIGTAIYTACTFVCNTLLWLLLLLIRLGHSGAVILRGLVSTICRVLHVVYQRPTMFVHDQPLHHAYGLQRVHRYTHPPDPSAAPL